MSVCSCARNDSTLGARLSGPYTARRAVSSKTGKPYLCPICGSRVLPGDTCLDLAGLHCDDYSGFFFRMHAECFRLMAGFNNAICRQEEPRPGLLDSWDWLLGAEFHVPWDADEAADHAVANGHHPYWRAWLELYEMTWEKYERFDAEADLCLAREMLRALADAKPDWVRKYYDMLEPIVRNLASGKKADLWSFIRSLPPVLSVERLLKCT